MTHACKLERTLPPLPGCSGDSLPGIAQVIACVFSLNSLQPGVSEIHRPAVEVPVNLCLDNDGKIDTGEKQG